MPRGASNLILSTCELNLDIGSHHTSAAVIDYKSRPDTLGIQTMQAKCQRLTTVDLVSPCGIIDLPIGVTSANFARRTLPTQSIGPLIASYLTERPSELKMCSRPCPGPHWCRWKQKSTLLPLEAEVELYRSCRCDGKGFCLWSRDLGRFRTLRCTCPQSCGETPVCKWRADAYTVLRVLILRQ